MRLELDLQTIIASKKIAQKLLIKVTINQTAQLKSAWAHINKKHIFPFFQKNIITIPDSQLMQIKFQIRNQQRLVLAQITVLRDIINKNEIQFTIGKDKIKLKYSLIQVISQDVSQDKSPLFFKKKISLQQELQNSQGQVQMLILAKYLYQCAQRLGPIIQLFYELQHIISWRSPTLTIVSGTVLTLIIFYFKISLLAGAVFLMFGKNILIRKIEKISKKTDFQNRILPSEKNTNFCQNLLANYVILFQKIKQFCLNEDKTNVINLIHHVCQGSFIIFVALFIFSLETLIAMVLWAFLILFSPLGVKLFKQICPGLLYFSEKMQTITSRASEYFEQTIFQKSKLQQVIKQFYVYEYERWIIGKNWTLPIKLFQHHIADQSQNIQLFLKGDPPSGWKWRNQKYEVQRSQKTDVDGYEYANQILGKYVPKNSIATTLRRRRFIRKCELILKTKSKAQ